MQQCLHENLAVSVGEHPDLMLLYGSRGGVISTSDDEVGDRSTSQAGGVLYPPPLVRIEARLDALDFPCRPLLMSGSNNHDFPLRALYGIIPYTSTDELVSPSLSQVRNLGKISRTELGGILRVSLN